MASSRRKSGHPPTVEEYSSDAFANRDSPIPVIRFDHHDGQYDHEEDAEGEGGVKHARERSARSRFGDKARKMAGRATEKGSSMQDRLLEKLLEQVIPIEDQPPKHGATSHHDHIERPSFSLPTMSTNFRRFNARIGVVFVFQARMIRLLSWRTPSHTISLLAVYTFVCLDPYLLSVLPLAGFLLGIFIPAFMARHPAPPIALTTPFEYSPRGPPIAPASTVKPVKELSKDFFRNMRDLQNCMEDFSQVHDHIIATLAPSTNFSNEPLSSTLFLLLFMSTAALFIASHLLPWRLTFLLGGWFAIVSGHPAVAQLLAATHDSHVAPREPAAASLLNAWIARDIILDSAPETREVEIFELQKLGAAAGEWEPWLFSPSPYDPLCRPRIADERPRGTRFFEDVAAPGGWEWSDKKWALDLWSREWVEERIITGVEVETEGERWVYDVHYEDAQPPLPGVREAPGKGKQQAKPMPTWEEGVEGQGKKGLWRRRRWVRLVQRKVVVKPPGEG